jgi:hypothetical protein
LCFFGILQVIADEEGKKRGSRDWPSFLLGLSCGGAWGDTPPLFLRLQKAFPAISGV